MGGTWCGGSEVPLGQHFNLDSMATVGSLGIVQKKIKNKYTVT